jgi:hypothetical protein
VNHRFVFACLTLALSAAASSRPVIIEENATLSSPLPAEYPLIGQQVATNGEYALVSGYREDSNGEVFHHAALLFRRVNGAWQFDHVVDRFDYYYDSYFYPVRMAMKGNLAAYEIANGVRVLELTAGGWTPTATDVDGGLADDLETDGIRVLAGVGGWDGKVLERNASGTWTSQQLQGQPRGSDDEFWGGPVDIKGNYAVLGTPYTSGLGERQEIPIYERGSAGWQLLEKIQVPQEIYALGADVAIGAGTVTVDYPTGPYVFDIGYLNDGWGRIQAVDAFALRGNDESLLEKNGDYTFVLKKSPDLGSVIQVFRAHAGVSGLYDHLATLVTKNGAVLGRSFDVAGSTVIAAGNGLVHVWELPETIPVPPAPVHDDFESGNAASWTQGSGAQFAVTQLNSSTPSANRVFRQLSDVGDAHAVLAGTTWKDQAVEADIKPTYFKSTDRWAGLATRYSNPQNYYYVTLRNPGSIQLKRMAGGVFATLATAPLTVTAFHTYRVRLESVGSTHRVYVDGRLVLSASDTAGPSSGSPALVTYQTRADYDNVIASPGPRATIFANDFSTATGSWTFEALGQWNRTSNGTFAQNSIGGDARALIGTWTDDQVVSARMRYSVFAPASAGQERWFGLTARYRGPADHYYVSLRSGNTLQLRKMQFNRITTLGSVPLTLTPGTWYTVRLDAIGDVLRVWVNGAQVLQARDSTHPTGRPGLLTYKTAAEFDNFAAYQP